MSTESVRTAGLLLIVFPSVVFGRASLLWRWITKQTTHYDHPLRRSLWPAPALLLPIAFFLSIAKSDAERPDRLIDLAYDGAGFLTFGMLTLGVGLLRAG